MHISSPSVWIINSLVAQNVLYGLEDRDLALFIHANPRLALKKAQ